MNWPGYMAGEVLRYVSHRPETVRYPFEKVQMPEAFRGKIRFLAERCVGCKLCEKDCPSRALTIEKVGEKRYQAVFHLDRCIYCAQCVDSCNKDALESTPEFELASLDRGTLRVVFQAPAAPAGSAAPAAGAGGPSDGRSP